MYKNKYSPEEKILIVKKVIERKHSLNSLATSYCLSHTILKDWVRNYQTIGAAAFYTKGWTKRTSE